MSTYVLLMHARMLLHCVSAVVCKLQIDDFPYLAARCHCTLRWAFKRFKFCVNSTLCVMLFDHFMRV